MNSPVFIDEKLIWKARMRQNQDKIQNLAGFENLGAMIKISEKLSNYVCSHPLMLMSRLKFYLERKSGKSYEIKQKCLFPPL